MTGNRHAVIPAQAGPKGIQRATRFFPRCSAKEVITAAHFRGSTNPDTAEQPLDSGLHPAVEQLLQYINAREIH